MHGTINLSNSNSHYGLKIDDRTNPDSGTTWNIDNTKTVIDDLTVNYPGVNAPAPPNFFLDIFSKYEAFPKVGTPVTLFTTEPPFHFRQLNGAAFPTLQLFGPSSVLSNLDGDAVNVSHSVSGNQGGPLTFGASNLPPGLSINPATGVISGVIPPQAHSLLPYQALVSVSNGAITRARIINWYVSSGITIAVPFPDDLLGREGSAASLGPITTTNRYNRPVTLSVTGLPTGLFFDPGTRVISGTIAIGAAQNGPYHVNIHATDGTETADYPFDWPVTAISFTAPSLQVSRVGESVNLPIQATTLSGAPVVFSAQQLPSGLSIDPASGIISGVVSSTAASFQHATITATQGNDVAIHSIDWRVVPAGLSDFIALVDPGNQTNREGDNTSVRINATSTLGLSLAYSVQGLPPGLAIETGEGYRIGGQIQSGAASGSPYHVTLTATDGRWSDAVTFDWFVAVPGSVDVSDPGDQFNLVNDVVNLPIQASTSLSQPLAYSATGLPTGLSINPQTGVISGVVASLASLPSVFDVSVSVTDGNSTYGTTFIWNIASNDQSNVIALPKSGRRGFLRCHVAGWHVANGIHRDGPRSRSPRRRQLPLWLSRLLHQRTGAGRRRHTHDRRVRSEWHSRLLQIRRHARPMPPITGTTSFSARPLTAIAPLERAWKSSVATSCCT